MIQGGVRQDPGRWWRPPAATRCTAAVEQGRVGRRRWRGFWWLPSLLLLVGTAFAAEGARDPLELDKASRVWLSKHPVIRVGVATGWEPIEFIDAKGHYQGIVADWMTLLSQRLGVRFEYVHRESWDAVMAEFDRGEIDVLAALTETPERMNHMLFTQPYLNFDTGLISRDDAPYVETLADFPAGRLAVVKGYASSASAAQRAPHLKQIPVADTEQALLAVSTGQADVAVMTVLVAHYLARQHGLANLRVGADHDDYPAGLAMAIRPELAPLRDALQVALDSVSPTERAAISSRWVNLQQVRPSGLSRAAWLTLFGLLAGLVVMAGWVYTLRRQIRISRTLQRRAVAAEQRLAEIAANAPGVLWQVSRDAAGKFRCLYMSQLAERATGIAISDFMADAEIFRAAIHPDDQPAVRQTLEACSATSGQQEYRHRLRTRRGDWVWVQVTLATQPRQDGSLLITGFSRDITAQQRVENELAASQQRLQDLAAGVPGALWQFRQEKDGRQRYTYMSDGIKAITGRTPAETDRLMQEKSFVSVHPEDQEILRQLMLRLTEKPGIQQARYRLHTVDHRWVWVQSAARAMPPDDDGAVVWNGITLDATEQQETEQALRVERQRIEDIARNFPGAIFQILRGVDGSHLFTYVSEGITKLTGRPPRTADGRAQLNDYDHIHPEDRVRVRAASERMIAEAGQTQFDYRLLDAQGRARWVHCAMNSRRQADGSSLINGLLLDAEDTKQQEIELRAARERAETASRAKTRFLANMSHEIRTPMNAVIGLAHIAMTSETTPIQRERIAKIHKAGKGLLKLLNDILEYARLDAGKFTPVLAPFALAEMQEALRLFCVPVAETKGLQFRIDCANATPTTWMGDATRIQQVLLNLITNAIKFTESGRVTLLIQPLGSGQEGLRFLVQDTGIGMTAEQMQRVFEAFEQASGDTERRYGGTGLGLSISRELVQALGGRLSVQSTSGQGTCFTVELPMQAVQSQAAPNSLAVGKDIAQALAQLGTHLSQRDTVGARSTLQSLRLRLIPLRREGELHAMERLIAALDIEAAQVELAQLGVRWGVGKSD